MPARRARPRKGDRRIDAAIDHFAAMGYAERDVRDAVASLLEVYGGPSAWHLLEEGSYHAVQEKLFEKEEEEKQKQPLLLEDQQVEGGPSSEILKCLASNLSRPVTANKVPSCIILLCRHQEPAVDKAPPENDKLILQLHKEVTAETESAHEEVEDPMFIEPAPLEAIVPLTAALGTGRTRRPCYGWLSESEDEEELISQHHEVHVPGSGLLKRK